MPELAVAAWALSGTAGLPPFAVVGSRRILEKAARRRGLHLPEGDTPAPERAVREAALADCAARLDARFVGPHIYLDGGLVDAELRDEQTSQEASRVAALGPVRAALLARQRAFRQLPGLVTDGRDMATVVFPDARLKVFLTASAEERARRRYKQLIEKGLTANIDDLLRDIRERDARDASRAHAPLVQDADAGLLDTTCLTADAAVAEVLRRFSLCSPPSCD